MGQAAEQRVRIGRSRSTLILKLQSSREGSTFRRPSFPRVTLVPPRLPIASQLFAAAAFDRFDFGAPQGLGRTLRF
jgi:hypothetical protein